jgi:hypothetical protein
MDFQTCRVKQGEPLTGSFRIIGVWMPIFEACAQDEDFDYTETLVFIGFHSGLQTTREGWSTNNVIREIFCPERTYLTRS